MCVCVWEGDENPTGQIWDKQYVCVGHISNAKSSIQLSNFLLCDWLSSTLHLDISSTTGLFEHIFDTVYSPLLKSPNSVPDFPFSISKSAY